MTQQIFNKRDTRIDVFRALALLMMFIDHVPGTIFEHFTYRNFGFSDAAEIFVLISGISIGLAYGSKFQPSNELLVSLRLWRRAGILYTTHVMMTMATLGIFCYAGLVFHRRHELLSQINIGPVIKHPIEALFGLVTFGHQLGYNNILPIYVVLLLMTPILFFLARISLSLMISVSGLIWLISGIYRIAPTNYPTDGVWFFNPLSWQFLFAIGIASILYIRRGGRVPTNPWLIAGAIGYLLLAFLWIDIPLWGRLNIPMSMPDVLIGVDKTFLSAPRLLHILAASYLIVAIPAFSNFACTTPNHPLAILGKHSLPVFIVGTLFAMIVQVIKLVKPGGFFYDAFLISSGIGLQFMFAYYLEWLPLIGWNSKDLPRASLSSLEGELMEKKFILQGI